eukprot:scaffold370042_cov19-Prasinocladus_malaysianus.AAC.1
MIILPEIDEYAPGLMAGSAGQRGYCLSFLSPRRIRRSATTLFRQIGCSASCLVGTCLGTLLSSRSISTVSSSQHTGVLVGVLKLVLVHLSDNGTSTHTTICRANRRECCRPGMGWSPQAPSSDFRRPTTCLAKASHASQLWPVVCNRAFIWFRSSSSEGVAASSASCVDPAGPPVASVPYQ